MTKITLVEDDATMRSLLKTLLEIEGNSVTAVAEYELGKIIASVEKDQPSIVVLDVNLRQLSGLDVLKSIRQSQALQKQPKVFMTSGSDMQDKCLAAGADGFLMKPYMPDDLIQWIKKNSSA
jgi:CheY-like chemotaxis protein